MIPSFLLSSFVVLAQSTAPASAGSSDAKAAVSAAHDLYDRVTPSLVVVRYTYDGEAGRRELEGAGIVIDDQGTVICSSGLTPPQLPDAFLKDFKIIVPGDEETEIDATLLGRDDRVNLTYVRVSDKSKSSHKWTPIKFEDAGAATVGEPIYSIGILPKSSGYKSYFIQTHVAAMLRGPVPQVLSGGEGLAAVGSPVFNAAGQAIGLVESQTGQSAFFNPEARTGLESVTSPPHTYVPAADFLHELSNPPKAGEAIAMPWAGIAELNGLKKDVAEYYGIKDGSPASQVGDVIPSGAAAKAGLKAGDVIVGVNGKPLERGDSPDESWMIMTRKFTRMSPGDEVTLSVISEKGAAPREVKLKLEERPMPASRAKRFYAEDLGFAVRDVVFEDTYERKLPIDSGGVVVGFIKPSSSAAAAHLGGTREAADLITQFNGEKIKNVDDFKTRYEQMRKDKPKDAIVLEVMRGSNTQVIRIEPPQ